VNKGVVMGDKRGAVPTYVAESIRRNLIATAHLLVSAQHCEIGQIGEAEELEAAE